MWTFIKNHALSASALVLCLTTLILSDHFDSGFVQGSYVATILGGLALAVLSGFIIAKTRDHSLPFLFWQMTSICLAMTAYTVEEIGWAFWRAGMRPEWFEYTLSPFLKAIQGASWFSAVAVIAAYVLSSKYKNFKNVALFSWSLSLIIFLFFALSFVHV